MCRDNQSATMIHDDLMIKMELSSSRWFLKLLERIKPDEMEKRCAKILKLYSKDWNQTLSQKVGDPCY